MKTILSAIVALSVLTGVAASANAFDAKSFYAAVRGQQHPLTNSTKTTLGNRRLIMKTILSAIVALSVLTGVAASANAFDAKSFYEQFDGAAPANKTQQKPLSEVGD